MKKISINNDLIESFSNKKSKETIDLIIKCIDTEQAVFEQSPDLLFYYISYGSNIMIAKTKLGSILPITYDDNELIMSFPLILNFDELAQIVNSWKKSFNKISIKYYSENQSTNYTNELTTLDFVKNIRSENEVFYSTKLLSELPGKKFSKIRYKKNKIIKNPDFELKKFNLDMLDDAKFVLDNWNSTRLHIYKKDRKNKELNYLKQTTIANNNNISNHLLYYKKMPVGLLSIDHRISQGVSCTTILKGLNDETINGAKGSSDYLYFSTFEIASSQGIDFINDGELGTEDGTRIHKLQFQPILSRKVYDFYFKK
ncbi:MAG: phosphatidylglycerol lysyltransferase domain-containing protein [Candidatus Saccharibacteria bacterium]